MSINPTGLFADIKATAEATGTPAGVVLLATLCHMFGDEPVKGICRSIPADSDNWLWAAFVECLFQHSRGNLPRVNA